ncbi:MAG TPA: DUF4105 domain-containing protein [Longimicrobiaceae bacterium]|nr:DUF4105 domain-containing protein [Longimicrobiaceae bacterium]
MRFKTVLTLALMVAAASLSPAYSQRAPGVSSTPGSQLTVYVMTMGPGDLVWERFGHNAIWIHDELGGTDIAYNYGMFDFQQENFLLRFAQGRMLYWMEGFNAELMAQAYIRADRTVWVQELNLTPAERAELRDFLVWNARPENRYYLYNYYYDNCSTRVRDAIDLVLGGRLEEQTAGVPSGATYRSHTRRLTSNDVPVYTGLMLGLGQPVDVPISLWEEMFLPLKLRTTLNDLTVLNELGQEEPLVVSERLLYESTKSGVPASPPHWISGYLLASGLVAGIIALLGWLSPRRLAARRGFVSLSVVWSLFAGSGGLILAALWALTDHTTSYRNENLFQLNPLSLALIVLIPALAFGAEWAVRPARWLAFCVAGLAALGFVLQILPWLDQVNGAPIALALPIHISVAWGVVNLARNRIVR